MKKRGMTTDEVISNYPEPVKILLRDLLLKIDAQIQQKPTVSEKEMMDELFFGQGFGLNDVRRMIDWLKSKGVEVGD